MRHIAVSLSALVMGLLGATAAIAHPHVWIENAIEFAVDPQGFKSVRFSWLFDPMFSSVVIRDHDADKDGQFSSKEVEAVRQSAFTNLKEYNYLTFLRLDDRQIRPESVEGFSAAIQDGRVRYRFTFPVSGRPRRIEVAVFDETYYVAVQPTRDRPFSLTTEGDAAATCALGEGKPVNGLFGSFAPPAVICSLTPAQ